MSKHNEQETKSHGHDHSHSMTIYEFLGRILAEPLDETLRFNVCSVEFWKGLYPKISNLRTMGALNALEKAVAKIESMPEDSREDTLNNEYRQMFCGDNPLMPPCEHAYDMQTSDIYGVIHELGITPLAIDGLAIDHLASELLILAPVEEGMQLGQEQLAILAKYFEEHPIALAQEMISKAAEKDDPTSGFYQAIVKFSLAWLRYDLDAFEQ